MKKVLFQLMICVAILIGTNGKSLMAQPTFYSGLSVDNVLEKLNDGGIEYSRYSALKDIHPCVEEPCTKFPFVCKNVELDDRKYVSDDPNINTTPLKYMITGCYWFCNGKFGTQIVDIMPQIQNGATYTGSRETSTPEYKGYLIQLAQLQTLTIMANNTLQGGTLGGDEYHRQVEFYSASCWREQAIMRLSDPVKKEWEYCGINFTISIEKSNVNANSSKTDELQSSDEYLWGITSCDGQICCMNEYKMLINYDKEKNVYSIDNNIDFVASSNTISGDCGVDSKGGCQAICNNLPLKDTHPTNPSTLLNSTISPNPNLGQMT